MVKLIETYKKHLISEHSYSTYTIDIYTRQTEKFLQWYKLVYPNSSIKNINQNVLYEYKKYLACDKSYSKSGVRLRIFCIISFCKFLGSIGHSTESLNLDVEIVYQNHSRFVSQIPTDNEIEMFRNEVYKRKNSRDIAIVELLLNTGIKYCELLALKNSNIEITGSSSLIKIHNKKSLRVIPLNTTAKNAVNLYLNGRNDNSRLWTGERGYLTRDGVNKIIKRYAKRAGLSNKISPNSLREFFAANLATVRNLDPKTFANVLGRKNINILNRYIQPGNVNINAVLEDIYA